MFNREYVVSDSKKAGCQNDRLRARWNHLGSSGLWVYREHVWRTIVTFDHGVSLPDRDGSIRIFHLYGRQPPNRDQEITLPVDGRLITARVYAFHDTEEAGTKVRQADAIEI
jgi:hypothetical protein